ncbi:MAG: NnrS family protein [Chloroflexi bacterium]|nr:NnrS family protein [Chloroflexota bacterium]
MRYQLVALPVALVLLLLALVLGVLRLLSLQGIFLATPLDFPLAHHGELMIFGFLAPVILVERYLGAAGFRLNRSINLMPFLLAVGPILKALSWLVGIEALNLWGSAALVIASALYLYILFGVGRQSAQPLAFYYMALGGLVLLGGTLLSLSRSPRGNLAFTLFLLGFPLFTILGERVELSRFLSPQARRRAQWGLPLAVVAPALLLVGILPGGSDYLVVGWAALIAGLVALLLPAELTLIRVGQGGLYRYLGRHLLLAYGWLFVGLALLVLGRGSPSLSDAAIHALAIGFVLTMIMAHAPIIAPVISGRRVAEEGLGYYPLALLTLSLVMRVGGQLLSWGGVGLPWLVGLSGPLALLALLAFGAMLLRSLRPA